jgi:polyhydroxyalkanoate synthesis regulator phasin
MTDKMTRDEVLAVIDGMIWACKAERETWDDDGTGRYDEIRKQAEAKEAATRTAVSALYDEVEAYRAVLRECQDGRRISNPHTRQVARDIEQQAIDR